MNQDKSQIEETLHRDGQFLLFLAESLAAEIAAAGAMLHDARVRGNAISVCGNRTSGALTAAAGMPYDVYLPPGRTGDVMLIVLPDTPTDDLAGVIDAGRERGLLALALVSDASRELVEHYADHLLHVPTGDSGVARMAMVAVLRAAAQCELELDSKVQ